MDHEHQQEGFDLENSSKSRRKSRAKQDPRDRSLDRDTCDEETLDKNLLDRDSLDQFMTDFPSVDPNAMISDQKSKENSLPLASPKARRQAAASKKETVSNAESSKTSSKIATKTSKMSKKTESKTSGNSIKKTTTETESKTTKKSALTLASETEPKVTSKSAPKTASKAVSSRRSSSKKMTSKMTSADASLAKDHAAPKSVLVLSEAEKSRRKQHEIEKKLHEMTAAESAYNQGLLPGDPLHSPLPIWKPGWLLIQGARQNNLKSIDVPFPLSAFTAVTGVSGSGKSSLVEDVLYRALAKKLHRAQTSPGAFDRLLGLELINKVIQVDQQPLGQTPTSNPATYTGAFDLIRNLFAQLPESKLRGYTPRRFSFNAPGGRCEKCEGAGQLKIEMQFLADVWITCDACNGKRYEPLTLEVKYRNHSISDVLDMSCGEALRLFADIPAIARILRTLCDVGLDYLTLGQPAPTLSGGEAQRVKLASELARPDTGRTLYILDEPTTGLHFEDLRKLLDVIHRLVDLGNTVIVIEHNLDIIKSVDWVIELGPEAGLEGGHLVFAGTPEQLVQYELRRKALPEKDQARFLPSHTADVLQTILDEGRYEERKPFDIRAYAEELQKVRETDVDEAVELKTDEAKMPWESNGRLWHTVNRVCRSGTPCRWDGRILDEVVNRIEESSQFSETDWNNRTIVEIRADKKSLGWFFHAITGEEWLLKLKFRTAKNTFKKELLIKQLDLRPLNDMNDIPLYGTLPRVRVEVTGPWQEIELKVYSYEEIDRPEFWDFLNLAIAQFGRFTDKAKENLVDLTPWRTLGREWHLNLQNCYGGNDRARWERTLLEKIFQWIEDVSPDSKPVWTNKVIVPFYRPSESKRPWVQVYTKHSEFVCVQLNVNKHSIPLGRLLGVGEEPEVDGSNADYDVVYLRFSREKDLNESVMRALFEEVLASDSHDSDMS